MSEDCAVKKQKIWRRVLQWAFGEVERVAPFAAFSVALVLSVTNSRDAIEASMWAGYFVIAFIWWTADSILDAIKDIK
jgi:hypothetical protein